jgi:hypothetical protein
MELGNSDKRIHLPAEILSLIFSYQCLEDVRIARLICMTFYSLASSYFLDTAIAGSQTATIERLEAIAKHDVLRTTVTTVVYAVCSLNGEFSTVNGYYDDMHMRHRYSEKLLPTLEQCKRHWIEYQRIYRDQVELQKGEDKIRIQNALRHMPNVKHLVLSGTAWKLPSHPLNTMWCQPDYSIIEPNTDPDNGPWQFSHGFNVMSSALLANRICLSSLSCTNPTYTSDSFRSSCFTESSQELFRSLRRIVLYLSADFDQSLRSENKVGECISAARELEHLELVFEPDGQRQIMFPQIFLAKWPELYHLKLEIDIGYDLFTAFCQRHGNSLRSLHLENLHLFGGTWEMLVQGMRDCLHLTNVCLSILSEDPNQDKVWERRNGLEEDGRQRLSEAEEYLLCGGENPFRNNTFELVSL